MPPASAGGFCFLPHDENFSSWGVSFLGQKRAVGKWGDFSQQAYLKNGETSVIEKATGYDDADYYSYIILDDGSIQVDEINYGSNRTKTHYILPEK